MTPTLPSCEPQPTPGSSRARWVAIVRPIAAVLGAPRAAAAGAGPARPDMAALAARLAPAVVKITITGSRRVFGEATECGQQAGEGDALGDFVRRLRRRSGGLPPQLRRPGPAPSNALLESHR